MRTPHCPRASVRGKVKMSVFICWRGGAHHHQGCTGTLETCLGSAKFICSFQVCWGCWLCTVTGLSQPLLRAPLQSLQLHSFQNSKRMEANLPWQLPCCPGILSSGEQFSTSKSERTTTLLKKTTYCPFRAIQISDILKIHFHESTYKFTCRGSNWEGFRNTPLQS